MKIYIDVCAIQRPLDTPDQIRNAKQPGKIKVVVVSPVELAQELEKWLTN